MFTVIIPILGGRLTKSGNLSFGTRFRLWWALVRAKALHHVAGVSHEFAFPKGGRTDSKKMRPCDVLCLKVKEYDSQCLWVNVPPSDVDLVTLEECSEYVEAVSRERNAQLFSWRHFFGKKVSPSDDDTLWSGDIRCAEIIQFPTNQRD